MPFTALSSEQVQQSCAPWLTTSQCRMFQRRPNNAVKVRWGLWQSCWAKPKQLAIRVSLHRFPDSHFFPRLWIQPKLCQILTNKKNICQTQNEFWKLQMLWQFDASNDYCDHHYHLEWAGSWSGGLAVWLCLASWAGLLFICALLPLVHNPLPLPSSSSTASIWPTWQDI